MLPRADDVVNAALLGGEDEEEARFSKETDQLRNVIDKLKDQIKGTTMINERI